MKTTLRMKAFARFVALASVGAALSGCVYDVGLGYASDGYYDDAYGCDPYSGYDRYHDCDYGHGFNNIGYGGGWYDNYWYPGYGFFLFDNIGRRYPMRDHHRRYWGEKRHNWYRENRRRAGDGGRFERRNRGYIDDGQRPRDGRREGRRARNDQWRGGDGGRTGAVPVPNTVAPQRQGRGQNSGSADGQPNRRGSGASDITTDAPPLLPRQQNVAEPPTERVLELQGQRPPRQRLPEGGIERPD